MTDSADIDRPRIGTITFRLEISDFGAFYERTYGAAYRTALGLLRDPGLAADVTQEAFVSAYRQRDRFRGTAPSMVWLHRIVVNQAIASLRRRRPAQRDFDLSLLIVPDDNAGTASRLALLDALNGLPHRHRAAVILRYYHDYDYATVADILGTTSSNVGAMLSRALDRLRAALDVDERAVPMKAGKP